MIVTFNEIINEVLTFLKLDTATVDANVLTSIKLRINQIQDMIVYDRNWEWRKQTFYITTRKPYNTGTVTVTEASRSVSSSGATFTVDMKDGYLLVNSKAYKILSVDEGTDTLTLEDVYPDSTESAISYSIIFPDYVLPHNVTGIISVKLEGRDLDVVQQDQLFHSVATTGTPDRAAFGKRTQEDFFNDGTVAVTNDSTTVELTGGTLPTNIEGMNFRTVDNSKVFRINTRTDADTFELREKFDGTTASGKSYAINPKGSQVIRFSETPDDYYFMEINALVAPEKLVGGNDYSIVPNHAPLLHGAIWLAAVDLKNENPVRIQQARADFDRTLKQLQKTYKSVANLQWTSNQEYRAKKRGITDFNPLDDREPLI